MVQVTRKGGDLNTTLYVDYRTVDGTANAGSDYEFTEDTIRFEPGETVKNISIKILDDDIFEEDEYFTVELFNVRSGSSEGMFDTNVNSATIARLDAPSIAHIIILDDDHAGVFTFACDALTVRCYFLCLFVFQLKLSDTILHKNLNKIYICRTLTVF